MLRLLLTKDALLDAVWGHRHVSGSVLKSTISQLRIALDDDAKQPRYIETAAVIASSATRAVRQRSRRQHPRPRQ